MKAINSILCRGTSVIAACALSAAAFAGGPLNLNPNDPDGVERWPNGGVGIPYNVDGVPAGGPDALALGPLTYNEAVAAVEAALATWESIPTATQTYSTPGPMPFDIDVTNYAPFVENLFFGTNNSDGFSPVVFDADGSIFVDLFGVSGVLGFASTDTRDADGTPIEAVNFLNGGAILGGFPLADFEGVIFHEFGHYSGLAHTVVNGQNIALGDTSGPTPFNTFGDSPGDQVETMYPFAIVGGGQVTPHADDAAFMSFLYPSPTYFANSGTITGTILTVDGTTPVTGVNVIARNVADPFVDAVSSISGDRGVTGVYTINGLTPGAEYTVHIDQILQGGFSTPPFTLGSTPEEFYNAGNESNNVDVTDDPAEAVPVVPVAGTPNTDIDVIFNGFSARPGDPLPLGDDDTIELVMPFSFGFCGQNYGSVFVNSNGSVSFGAGDTAFGDSIGGLLAGPPRIAGLWDDLNPTTGGVVTFDQTDDTFSIIFDNVPEFLATGGNSFEIILMAGSNDFDINYGAITATDGLAGYSCGGGVTSGFEGADDLSELPQPIQTRGRTAVFEQFNVDSPNDLADSDYAYRAVGGFRDRFEPNDAFARSTRIRLPFDTVDRYSEIDPAGGDVDWYRFEGEAGTTVVAEVLTGQLDSVLGLYRLENAPCRSPGCRYDPTRPVEAIPLIIDDDGGAGVLSRILFALEETGSYAIAVSTFPDFDFTGAGGSAGRYVLSVQSIDGILLSLGDDDFEEVPLGFSFPFNGQMWDSVFVNSNGNLSFGSGSTDFTESVSDLLNGPPRIAPLFDDLSPNQGGLVFYKPGSGSFSLTFDNVPEFFASTGNTFTVTLDATGNVQVTYGEINATDGIAGVSEGGGAPDPGPTDVSAASSLSAVGTTYEQFGFSNPNDLSFELLIYTNP